MPGGIQLFNDDGSIYLDTNDRVGRLLGYIVSLSSGGGTISVPGFVEGDPFYLLTQAGTFTTTSMPTITINKPGQTLSWGSFPSAQAWALVYGVR